MAEILLCLISKQGVKSFWSICQCTDIELLILFSSCFYFLQSQNEFDKVWKEVSNMSFNMSECCNMALSDFLNDESFSADADNNVEPTLPDTSF